MVEKAKRDELLGNLYKMLQTWQALFYHKTVQRCAKNIVLNGLKCML